MQDKKTKGNEQGTQRGMSAFYNAIFTSIDVGGRLTRRARSLASFRPIKLLGAAVQSASYASTRTYGWFSMSFGLVSLFLHLAEYYFSSAPSEQLSQLVIGAVFAILSIPLMLVDIPMCEALQRFPITDYIIFEFFSVKRLAEDKSRKKGRPIIGMIIGFIPAIFGFFFPMELVVLVMGIMLLVTVSFVSPEFPFFLMLMLVPYVSLFRYSDIVLVAISLLSLLSFFAKVLLGKRYYSVGISDICMLAFAAVIVVFGVIGGGEASTRISLVLVALSFSYIPATNIIVNRRLADCAVDSIVFSAFPVAIIAIAEYVSGLVAASRAPSSSVMSSPYVLATYLSVAFVFAAYSVGGVRGAVKRAVYIAILPVLAIAIFTTECLPVSIVSVATVIAALIVRRRRVPKELLLAVALLPPLVFFLPTSVLSSISSVSPMSVTLVELREGFLRALDAFGESVVVGVGAADLSGDASGAVLNTILGVASRFGIFAVIVLCFVFVIRLRQDSVYAGFLKSSQLFVFSNMTTVAMFCMATCGWFCDVFADLGLYSLFFVLFGLNTAALRTSKHEYEERVGYFRDQKDIDSSTVDVFLRR